MYDPKKNLPIENKLNATPDPYQLVATDRIIEMAKRLGVSFGHGDPNERIRYFIKLGILPNAVRKSSDKQSPTTVGHLPYWVIKRLIVADRLKRSGASFQEIADKFKRIDKRKQAEASTQTAPNNTSNHSSLNNVKSVLAASAAMWTKIGVPEEEIEKRLEAYGREIERKLQKHKEEIQKEIAAGKPKEESIHHSLNKLTDQPLDNIQSYQNYLKRDQSNSNNLVETTQAAILETQVPEPQTIKPETSKAPLLITDHKSHSHRRNFITASFASLLLVFVILSYIQSPQVKGFLEANQKRQSQKVASLNSQNAEKLGEVLAASNAANKLYIDAVTQFQGETTFLDPITAPNVIYGITGGTGIAVTAGQNPVVSLDSTQLATSINSATGTITITGSGNTSVSTSGSKITISSSSSASGDITAVNAGDGLTGGGDSDDVTLSVSLTTTGTSTTTSSASGLELSSGLSLIRGCNNSQVLSWVSATSTWDCGSGGSFNSFTVSGDGGTDQTITDANTLHINGGTNGIDTAGSNTDILTINLDTTEIGTTTFGSGSSLVWTFDAGAVDPTIDFNSGAIVINEGGVDADLRIEGDNSANLFTLDAGLFSGIGQISIGASAQGTATAFLVVDNPAVTATSNQNFYKTYIDNNGAVTVAGGTTSSIVASLAIDEPNITATGTATNAATLYVSGAPTEGASGNFALWVDNGESRFENLPVTGSSAASALTVVPSYIVEANDITMSGIKLALDSNSNGDSGDVFYGFNADDFTTSAGPTEYGMRIGSGYDYQFYFELGARDLRVSATAPSAGTSPLTATIPALAADDTFCFATLGNCFGPGGGSGVTYTSQTTNAITKFTSTTGQITSSSLTDDGTTLTLAANVNFTITDGTGSITETFSPSGATGTARAVTVTPKFGIDATDQTLTGIYVSPNTNSNNDGGDVLSGIHVAAITGSSASEYGIQIGSGWDQNLYFNDTSTNVLLADGGTITITDGTNTLCTITDGGTTGTLNCTGNITGGSGSTVGFWSRTGTTLSPATANDIVSIANTTTSGADLAITNTGIYTGTGIFNLTADSATAGTIFALSADGITTGKGVDLTSTSNAFDSGILLNVSHSATAATDTTLTADIANLSFSPTYSTNVTTPAISGNVLDISRSTTTDTSFASTLTVSGALVTISDSSTQTTGTLTHTANVLDLTQNYTSSSGTALYVKNYGGASSTSFRVDDSSGDTTPFIIDAAGQVGIGDSTPSSQVEIGDGTDSVQFSTVGDMTFVDADSGATISGPAGGALNINGADSSGGGKIVAITSGQGLSGNTGGNLNLTSGAGSLGAAGGTANLTGGQGGATANGGPIAITSGAGGNTSGTSGTITMQSANNSRAGQGTGTVTIQSGTVTTGTSGNLSLSTGNASGAGTSGNVTLDVGSVVAGTLGTLSIGTSNATTITIGSASNTAAVTVNSGNITGTAFSIADSALTTGEILDITSTSAPSDGSTNEAIDLNITHTPTASADNFQAINLTTTDGTALGNTVYGIQNTLTLTGNAAKTGIGIYSTVTSSSTTADTLYSGYFASSITGVISAGARNSYGLFSAPASTAANTGGTTNFFGNYLAPNYAAGADSSGSTENIYGVYSAGTGTLNTGGTINRYGIYVANASMDGTGTSTQYGIHIAALSGADTNTDLSFASTAPKIAIGGGGTLAFTDGTNTLASIVDNGTYGFLRLSDKGGTGDPATCTAGDVYFNATDLAFKGCTATNSWEQLDNTSGGSLFTDSGTFTYLTSTTDDLVLGGSTVATGSFFMDVSAGGLFLGTNESINGSITLYSSGAGETDPTISANSTGDLTLTAATGTVIVGSGTGDITLDPSTNNLLANLSSTGDFLIQDNGTAFVTFSDTGTTTWDFTGTTTTGITANANSLTTGTVLSLASTATAYNGNMFAISKTGASGSTAFTADVANVTYSHTFNGGVGLASTGNVLDISRAITLNNAGNTHTISGAVVTISDTGTQTAGTLSHTASVLSLTQSYASSSGTTLAITNSGTGSAISSTSNTTSTSIANAITANGISSGTALDITSTGTITTNGELVNLVADSLTSGRVLRLSAAALSSGTAIEFTGPTATGITGKVISLTSDVGSAGRLIDLAPDFSGAGVTGYGIFQAATDSTTSTNTNYGIYNKLTLTGNAAKNGYGLYNQFSTSSTTADTTYGIYTVGSRTANAAATMVGIYGNVTSSSTTAGDTLYSGYFLGSRTGAGTGTTTGIYGNVTSSSTGGDTIISLDLAATQSGATTSGTVNVYGVRNQPTATGVNTSTTTINQFGEYIAPTSSASSTATLHQYGQYIAGTAKVTGAGTVNRYGVYVANGTMDATGTSTQYGIYVAAVSGADNNDALFTAGGTVQFTCTTSATTWTVSQANPSCSDYAEVYDTGDNSIEAADIVTIDTNDQGKVGKSRGPYQNQIIGAYSTSPGMLIGPQGIISAAGDTVKLPQGKIPVALSGRVPVKVSLEGGPIHVGDPITSSSVPGVGMKATQPGRIIGMALEDYNPETSQGKVLTFINPTYYFDTNYADVWSTLMAQTQQQSQQLSQEAADLHNLLAEDIAKADELLARLENTHVPTSEEISNQVKEEVTKQIAEMGYVGNGISDPQASGSAALAAQTNKTLSTIDGLLSTTDLKLDTLSVTGNTQLAQTQVAGTLSQDGTLIIDYGKQINVLGSTLYLQNELLSGDENGILLDIGKGKVAIDNLGNIVTRGEVQTKGLVLSETTTNSTVGSAKIVAGQNSVTVQSSALKPNAKVLITPTGPTGGRQIYLSGKQDYESFTVAIDNGPTMQSINFDWLIVNTTQISSN